MQIHKRQLLKRPLVVEDRAPSALELLPGPLLTAWEAQRRYLLMRFLNENACEVTRVLLNRIHESYFILQRKAVTEQTSTRFSLSETRRAVVPLAASTANDDRGA